VPVLLAAFPARSAVPGEVRIRSGAYVPAPAVTVSVQATLVEVGVTVRDRRGEAAGGFQAADFELLDDGKPQRITVFSEHRAAHPPADGAPARADERAPLAPPAPRTLALYFDDTHAALYDLAQARKAAGTLFAGHLKPGDRAGVFTDSGEVTLDFTADRQALLDAVGRVRMHPKPAGQSFGVCPSVTPYEAYAVSHRIDEEARQRLIRQAVACNCQGGDPGCVDMQPGVVQTLTETAWDHFREHSVTSLEVLAVVVRHLATMPGDRVLLTLSPGFVTGDLDRQKSAIVDAALRAHIVIHALNPAGLEAGARERPQTQIVSEFMAAAAHSTGGIFVRNSNDISGEMNRLASAPLVSYVLGFAPDGKADGRMHALKVRLKRGDGYQVESRTGYFPAPPPEPKLTAQQRIDRAARATESMDGVSATVQVVAERGAAVRVEVAVDAKALRYVARDGRRVQQLTFVALLEDANGALLEGKQATMDLDLGPATLADFRAKGIHAKFTFRRPKGDWRVRQVVREAADNRIGAWTVKGTEQ
jgi:VWFA-related protein